MKRRKDGRFAKQIYVGKKDSGKADENGNPIYTNCYKAVYGITQREVEEKVHELRIKLRKGIDYSSANDSFLIWANRFMRCKESEGLSVSHVQGLKNFIKHLEPIHYIPIEKVETQDVREVILDLYSEKRDANGNLIHKAYSKRTLTCVQQCARQIFNFAIESRAIDYNPAQFVKIPKDAHKEIREPLTDEQQCWINEFHHRAKRAAMLMLHAGLRRGEVVALTWADIDIKNALISVNKAVEYRSSNQAKLKSTKTESGIRTINIPKCLCDFLKEERAKDNCIYVLHMSDGKMMSEQSWRKMWDSYMRDLNVEYGYKNNRLLIRADATVKISKYNPHGLPIRIQTFTPHQLRHTFASNCYLAGVDVQTCMEWMGHSDVQTTLGIYTHLSKKHKKLTTNKLDDFYAQNGLLTSSVS